MNREPGNSGFDMVLSFWEFLLYHSLAVFLIGFAAGFLSPNAKITPIIAFMICLLYFVVAAVATSPKFGTGVINNLVYYGLSMFYGLGFALLVFPGTIIGRRIRKCVASVNSRL